MKRLIEGFNKINRRRANTSPTWVATRVSNSNNNRLRMKKITRVRSKHKFNKSIRHSKKKARLLKIFSGL